MIQNLLKILYVGSDKCPRINFEAYAAQFIKTNELEEVVEIICQLHFPRDTKDFTKKIFETKADLYILSLNADTESHITTYCELAWNLDRHTQIIVFQTDEGDYRELSKNLWGLGIREFLSKSMPKHEKFARFNKTISEYLFLKKYQNLATRLHEISLVDSLTGLSNMRNFYLNYKNLFDGIAESNKSLAIFMIDLDNFKKVNDCNSHLFGSYVLSQVGKLMAHSSIIPKGSLLARYGGDEFIWAVKVDSIEEATEITSRWLRFLKLNVFHHEDYSTSITASIGFSLIETGYNKTYDEPMKVADYMLYRSKNSGRDQAQGVKLSDLKNGIENIEEILISRQEKSRLKKPA